MIKKLLSLFVLFFMCVGIYALADKFMMLPVFTVSSVEVKGVSNSDRDKLITLGNTLVGMNIFDKDIEQIVHTDDPWVQRLEAVRAMPNSLNLIVFEEVPLYVYHLGDKCFTYVESGKSLRSLCNDTNISAESDITVKNAMEFAKIVKENEFILNTEIVLKPTSFEVKYSGVTIYSPYDASLFTKNYEVYSKVLRKRYKSVEYADLTIDEKIFVKGVRNDTRK